MTTQRTSLIAYHNNPALKSALLIEIGKHEAADQIIKGHYGAMNGQFTGCAIGCSLHSLNLLSGKTGRDAELEGVGQHDRFPSELGWPLWLAYYEDTIFENLPIDLSQTWPRRLAEAVPVGVTIPNTVLAKLQAWWLIHERFGVVNCTDDAALKAVISQSGDLFVRLGNGEDVPQAAQEQAAWAAGAAGAARAAWAAGAARAAGAVRAAWAAWAARDAGDAWAARDAGDARAVRAAGDAWAARAAGAAGAARAAWAAWAARAAGAAGAARAAGAAWAARDAGDARAVRAAGAAWAARAASNAFTRDDFYPALSEYLLLLLRTVEGPSLDREKV